MKVASIVPIKYLHLTKNDDYFMALAPLVLESKEYAHFFQMRSEEGKFVLLDNGAHESSSLDILAVHAAAHVIGATEIILPDVIGDTAATLEATYRGMKHFRTMDLLDGHKLMMVPQGADLTEWTTCFHMMMQLRPDSIGVPKMLTHRSGINARLTAVTRVSMYMQGNAIGLHLLGVWTSVEELYLFKNNTYVRGVDSTLPYLYAREGRVLGDGNKPTTIMDPYDEKTYEPLLKSNLNAWRIHAEV